jgi:ABC-type sugar transport system ATPase subunit
VPALIDGRIALESGSIHALCGGNGAGKSTFLNIVMGLSRRDGGMLQCRGTPVNFTKPSQALDAGISIITQELSPVPAMTVAENLWLGRERMRGPFVNRRRSERDAQKLFDQLGFDIDAKLPMKALSVAKMQLVEIAKAISYESAIIIMDEPTSAIGETETETLFRAIRDLAAAGTGIVYVSHRLNEIFQIADSFTVFRDGRYVESGRIADISRPELIRHIVGREVLRRPRGAADGANDAKAVLFRVENLVQAPMVRGIDLAVRSGEIVGIYGLVGAGRSEFLNAIYGLTRPGSGRITVGDRAVRPGEPRDAIRNGLSLVTEDRKETGLIVKRSVRENTSLAALKSCCSMGFISRPRETVMVDELMRRFQVKAATPDLPVASLSGGNQQKVVLSRCFSTKPRVLLCDEPTRGVDEGAKTEIYAILRQFVAEDNCAVLVSSDLEEILHISDRIVVFNRGLAVAELPGKEASNENLLHLAS